jgi:N-acetylglutamate synthase-like GNAT family acetyltransferase
MKIRAARRQDREQVLAFCKHTFSWGDYIDRVWDTWFSAKNGRLLVAEHGGMPVAMSHVTMCPGNLAWLEGVRVHPDFRRSGVATELLERMLARAGRLGARQASAIVAVNNTASQHMMEKNGFPVISNWAYYSTEAKLRTHKTGARLARPGDLPAIWDYLKQSRTYRQSAGRYVRSWQWYVLDRKALRQLVKEGHVVVAGAPIDGIAIINNDGYWDRADVLQVVYLDSEKSARDLLSFAINLYGRGGFSRLHVLCHESRHLTSMVEKFRIKESERFLLYNKVITG